jgi:hypothetical protein
VKILVITRKFMELVTSQCQLNADWAVGATETPDWLTAGAVAQWHGETTLQYGFCMLSRGLIASDIW